MAMTNFRAEDMPGAKKPIAKKAAPKVVPAAPKPAAKVSPKVEAPAVKAVEEDAPESE